jgi:hypothetical protein
MADVLEKTAEQLPDIWFDWYARLIPGCFGVGLYLYLSATIPASPTGIELTIFVLSGYALGHVLQPLAGFLVRRLENRFGNEVKYAAAKRRVGLSPSLVNKVSKAHAEASSMLAFGLALLSNIVWFWNSPRLEKWVAFGFLVYFMFAGVERTYARSRKIKDLG